MEFSKEISWKNYFSNFSAEILEIPIFYWGKFFRIYRAKNVPKIGPSSEQAYFVKNCILGKNGDFSKKNLYYYYFSDKIANIFHENFVQNEIHYEIQLGM
jgi:dephospho-CoA kinase